MKFSVNVLFSVSLIQVCEGLPQLWPQGGAFGSIVSSITGTIKLHGERQMTPEFRQDARRTQYRYGPLHLVGKNDPLPSTSGPSSLDKHGQAYRLVTDRAFCGNCTVLAGKVGVQYENGTEADEVYIHHFTTFDLSKSSPALISRCGSNDGFSLAGIASSVMRPLLSGFIGRGDDNGRSPIYFAPTEGNFSSGYFMNPGSRILMNVDLVNYQEVPADVYLYADLEYYDGHVGADAVSELLSVVGCDPRKQLAVSKGGPSFSEGPDIPVLQDGYIVSAKGHMHDGGEYMELLVNNKTVCTSHVEYFEQGQSEGAGGIKGMSRCGNAIPVEKGDVVKVKSLYDLTKHAMRMDTHGQEASGMGSFMGMWALTFTTAPT